MKNICKWVGVVAIIIAAALPVVFGWDTAKVLSIILGAFGLTAEVLSFIEVSKAEDKKEKIALYVTVACAVVGGVGVAIGLVAESAITTIFAAVIAIISAVLATTKLKNL